MVVLGAYTRLVDAGLGCPDWPGCYGFLAVPQSEAEIAVANSRFPEAPFDTAKAWPEMVHRYAATGLGLTILLMLGMAVIGRSALAVPVALVVLVIVQGIFGAWTVTLKLWPQVVTAHLLGGFATVALLAQYLINQNVVPASTISSRAFRLAVYVAVLLVLQITLGGWTSANYAALACPDFPLCHGQLIPDSNWLRGFNIFQSIGPNYLGGELSNEARIAIQFAHRLGALALSVATFGLIFTARGWIRWALGLTLLVQLSLGAANVLFGLALAVAIAHNFVALLFLILMVYILHHSRTRSSVG